VWRGAADGDPPACAVQGVRADGRWWCEESRIFARLFSGWRRCGLSITRILMGHCPPIECTLLDRLLHFHQGRVERAVGEKHKAGILRLPGEKAAGVEPVKGLEQQRVGGGSAFPLGLLGLDLDEDAPLPTHQVDVLQVDAALLIFPLQVDLGHLTDSSASLSQRSFLFNKVNRIPKTGAATKM
jgi:hypothetical protein